MDPAADRPGAGPVDQLLDLVTAAVLARKDHGGRPRDAAALGRFCRALLQRVAATELAMTDPDEIAPEVIEAYDLLADRPPGRTALRVAPLEASLFGPEGGRTVVEVAGPDRSLLFSTVMTALRGAGLDVLRFSHPILGVDRAEDGSVMSVGPAPGAPDQEVLVHMEVAEALDDEARRDVTGRVREAIDELDRAAADLDAIRRRLATAADRIEELGPLHFAASDCGEVAAFCRWLLDDSFLFVGMRHHPPDGALGVSDRPAPDDLAPVDEAHLDLAPLLVRRSRRTSRISRPERLAEVLLADLDDGGARVGVVQVLGLTSLRGRSERPSGTPWIRAKLRRVLAREQVLSGSHDETVLRTIFDGLPWDVLLLADVDWLRDTLVELLATQQTGGPAVRILPEPTADALTVLVGVPQESFRAELSVEIEQLLDDVLDLTGLESEAELSSSGLTMLSTVARLGPATMDDVDLDALEARLRELSRSWSERLSLALADRVGPDGTALARRWLHRLPAPYREATPPEVAAHDVLGLDEVDGTGEVRLRIVDDAEEGWHHLRLAVGGPPLELSGFLPVLESVGLVVAAEMTYLVDPSDRHPATAPHGGGPASVMDLLVSRADRSTGPGLVDPDEGERLGRAVLAAWSGATDVDRLNELVLRAGLDWEQVAVLRAYGRYLSQVVTGLRPSTVVDALAHNPTASRALWDWFHSRFGPDPDVAEWDRLPADGRPEVRRQVLDACDGVARLDQDRILRQMLGLVDATVRTNVWAGRRTTGVTVEVDGGLLPGRAAGESWREVWVSAPDVEGIHLRAGPVARGGLRWSDREGDVRTEVLQLMQAQELKNALIVPTGAKGGFVLRHRPEDPAGLPAAVRRAYTTFVGSLLDVVDDLVDGVAAHPAGVRRADGSDTYLVVAADRGTASFSDLANSLAEERGFWLGDAFASGGSDGYDHKALGVTARGAWVSVTEHFAGLGVDVATDPFSVVGIGDMSGDVFGNGMLRSRATRLVAAFDHRHVFIDPEPDPERSFRERQRLFALPRSSWDDYDRRVLSPGGMIVARSQKRVVLTPEAGRALGLTEAEAAGGLALPDLVRAVLSAPADLLYFGGIGTYVRASSEADGMVGDPANDEVRVDAAELRVRVVAEGANLGMTPRARVEYAAGGGLVNTDAIDNSAGVDSSDHEVNLKILLSLPERAGEIDRAERNRLLAGAADDVVARVLGNVAKQNRGLTREAAASHGGIEPFLALLFQLEADGALDRDTHALPSGSEVRRRREHGLGLYRPELAVLLAATKEQLAASLLEGALPDRAPLEALLRDYFPHGLSERFAGRLSAHPLRREIIASRLANEIVDRMGMTWVPEACRRSGQGPETVAAAYWMARETARIGPWWSAIDTAPLAERDQVWDPAAHVIDALAGDYLRRGVAAAWRWDEIERNALAAAVLARWQDGSERPDGDDATRPTGDLAEQAARISRLALAPGLAQVAEQAGVDPAGAVAAYLDAGRRFGLDRLTWAVLGVALAPGDTWSERHRESLLFDLDRLRRSAAGVLLAGVDPLALERRLAAVMPRLDEAMEAARERLDPLAVVAAELWLVVEQEAGGIPRA